MEVNELSSPGNDIAALDWVKILEAHPKAKEGMFNPDRKKLLRPGVNVLLSRRKAESWIPELRIRRKTAEAASNAQGGDIPENDKGVRVTIISIPDATRIDPVDGKIVVEADGIRSEIYASVFYNCIRGKDKCPTFFVSDEPLIGRDDFGVG